MKNSLVLLCLSILLASCAPATPSVGEIQTAWPTVIAFQTNSAAETEVALGETFTPPPPTDTPLPTSTPTPFNETFRITYSDGNVQTWSWWTGGNELVNDNGDKYVLPVYSDPCTGAKFAGWRASIDHYNHLVISYDIAEVMVRPDSMMPDMVIEYCDL